MARRRKAIYAPSEAGITAAVLQHWLTLRQPHSLVAAIPNMKSHGQPGLTKGLADLVVLAPGLPVGFIELKRDQDSPVTDEQRAFGRLCETVGIPFAICVGRDEPIRLREAWGVVRRAAA